MPHLNKQGEKCEECGHETCPYCNLGCHNTDCNRHMRPIDKCYNAFLISSSDTNREWERVREEWNGAIYEIGIDTFPNGEPNYSETASKIADWWLNKLQEELTRERETAYKQGVRDGKKDILDAMRKMVETL